MSRKYLNDRWCVRCGKTSPCPYIKKNVDLLIPKGSEKPSILDIGCGNGRNMNFLKEFARECKGVDMSPSCPNSVSTILGHDLLPATRRGWNLILANYVFMFLNAKERKQLVSEIKRVASPNAIIVVELYAAKDSEATTEEEISKMQEQLFKQIGWTKIKYSKARFIARKPQ